MQVADVVNFLDAVAPPALQEDYDNAGLLVGDPGMPCTGVLCTLDVTEAVLDEALRTKCNCIVAHHPPIFRALKRLTGKSATERLVIRALREHLAIYAIHTNLDHVPQGVNGMIAEKLDLRQTRILAPRLGLLLKLAVYVPAAALEPLRQALFAAGAGRIGNYAECSFETPGTGTFLPLEGTNPYVGRQGQRHREAEVRLEVILPAFRRESVLEALRRTHPYEEPAFDLFPLENEWEGAGAGLIGELPEPMPPQAFLELLRAAFHTGVIRHTAPAGKAIRRVALCGGAGSFLMARALQERADAFLTADLKYHEFFEAEGRMLLCDLGHFESEQFTRDLLVRLLVGKFPTFAVLKSETVTNPVRYYSGH